MRFPLFLVSFTVGLTLGLGTFPQVAAQNILDFNDDSILEQECSVGERLVEELNDRKFLCRETQPDEPEVEARLILHQRREDGRIDYRILLSRVRGDRIESHYRLLIGDYTWGRESQFAYETDIFKARLDLDGSLIQLSEDDIAMEPFLDDIDRMLRYFEDLSL